MPWAVHADTPPAGAKSHWITACSKALSENDRQSCAAASITLRERPADGAASVLMDGPSTGAGPAGLINCSLQLPIDQQPENTTYSAKKAACDKWSKQWARQAYDPDPKQPDCPIADVNCKVQRSAQDALSSGIRSGIQGLVDIVVQSTVFLMSKLAAWVFKVTAISSPDDAFYYTYNSVAGVMIVLIFVFFIASTIINTLRTTAGPGPVATLGGLLRAVLGVVFAAGIAYTIVAAWDQATNAVIATNARTPYDPSRLVTSFTELSGGAGTMFLDLLLAGFGTIGLLLLFVIMLFRGLLATAAAVFGAIAMSGQVMPETRHWGRTWFWTINALGSSKFVIAELWIYGSRDAYGTDSVMNALRAVLLIWLMVVAPFILLRLMKMWDGYLSDVNAHGLLSTAGNPLSLGQSFLDGVRSGGSGDGGNPTSGAAGLMNENTATMPTTPDAGPVSAGTGGEKGRQAADAAATGADGGKVGEPTGDPATEPGSSDASDSQEADGIEEGSASARHDVAAGQLTAPGDATGNQGSLPVTPGGTQNADPTGSGIAERGAGGAGASSGGTATPGDGSGNASSSPAAGGGEPGGGRPGASGSGGGEGAAGAVAEIPVVPI